MNKGPIIAAAVLALAACNRGGGEADRQAAASGQAQPPANIIVTTPEGTAEVRTGAAAALPAGLPPYPGAEPNAAVEVSGAPQNQGGIYGFRTADAPAQVIAFYAEAARRGGYRIANQMNMGATATLTAQKSEGEVVNITATQAGGATQVQLIVAHNQP